MDVVDKHHFRDLYEPLPPPRPPMSEGATRFRVGKAAPGYGYAVRRRASLRAVAGSVDFREPQRSVDRYLEVWRRRLIDLGTEHPAMPSPRLARLRGRIQAYLDCPPPFCPVVPSGRRCGDDRLCPSCRAVQAGDVWSRLDRGLFGDAPPRGARLVVATMLVRTTEHAFERMLPSEYEEDRGAEAPEFRPLGSALDYRLSKTRPLRKADPTLPRCRRPGRMASRPQEIERFRRLGVVAGLDAMRVGLVAADGYVASWAVRVTQALFAPADAVAGLVGSRFVRLAPGLGTNTNPWEIPPGRVRVRRVDGPSRRDVAEAVGSALRYDAEILLRGDRPAVTAYLHATHRRRLFAAFGRPEALRDCVRGGGK